MKAMIVCEEADMFQTQAMERFQGYIRWSTELFLCKPFLSGCFHGTIFQ